MHTFHYRLPRYSIHFPVEFLVGETTILGRCTDISEAGLRGQFRQPMPVGSAGLLTLNHAPWRIEVGARVAYFSSEQMVLRFVCGSAYERARLRQFMLALAG